ncbi:MAG: helix-turn-helix transcriptional regulator, partial [Oscillospiraceae bacterium]|nr:helix-turn-helix transcriptional regulator [Oscillospiraceae bacterium]
MDIGNQIKALRLRKGMTQDALARQFGVTPQAVSKWERGESVPDIALLPELSACFGVSIDELFAISDETHMTRIENMLNDV